MSAIVLSLSREAMKQYYEELAERCHCEQARAYLAQAALCLDNEPRCRALLNLADAEQTRYNESQTPREGTGA